MAGMLPFSDDEVVAMINSRAFVRIGDWPERNRTIFVVQLCLGPRISELLRLNIGDVVNVHGKIRNEIILKKTKNGEPRTVKAINPLLFQFLPPWLSVLNSAGYFTADSPLIPGRGKVKALSERQVQNIYQAAIDELKLDGKHSTHSCRKTWACQTYDWLCDEMRKGANIEPLDELAKIGGWKTIEAARRYIADHISRASESQAAIYSGVLEKLNLQNRFPKIIERE